MSPLRVLPWVLWLALAVFTAVTYDLLPAAIPQQIDAAGEVTRTTARTPMAWAALPAIAALTLGLLQGIGALLPTYPHLFNFPAKEQLLAMPAARRTPVISQMRSFLDVVGLFVTVVMFGAQWLLWQTAQGRPSSTGSSVLVAACVGFSPMLLLFVVRLNRTTERAHADWLAARP